MLLTYINLCASTDVSKAISSSEKLSAIHNRIISKCNNLWRAASRLKSSEILHLRIHSHTSRREHDEIRFSMLSKQILSMKDKCVQVFQALQMKTMITEAEFDYIKEHLECTKPVADALDIL